MGTQFRIDRIRLETSRGDVSYDFAGPLTVFTGPVGTGKSTLLELIKFGLGGKALLSPVAQQNVSGVELSVTLESERFSLARKLPSGDSVQVHDLLTLDYVGSYSTDVSKRETSISSFIMKYLGLPTDVRASSQRRSATSTPSPITFNDVYNQLYVDQPEIDRSIAHHSEPYREPKRRTTFELLFGLTDPELLRLREQAQLANQELRSAVHDEERISEFLANARMGTAEETEREERDLRQSLRDHQAILARLRAEVDPEDMETDLARDLLISRRARLDEANEHLRHINESIESRESLLAGLRQDAKRLNRLRDATSRLADIEFVVCPRCSQSLRNREVPPGACPVCVQDDLPSTSSPDNVGNNPDSYELRQLESQTNETLHLLESARTERAEVEEQVRALALRVDKLSREVDERTRELISPRLQAFADASSEIARAETRLAALNEAFRVWDSFRDVEARTSQAEENRLAIEANIARLVETLAQRRDTFLAELSDDYQRMVLALGIPSVREAWINDRNYLPVVDGKPFDSISTGGIRTALIVAYWVTLLATTLRETEVSHPSFLILDSPRKSIGAGEELAVNLYRQLDTIAEVYRDTAQIIVADNNISGDRAPRWQEFSFDYDNPSIPTISHPGPASVETLESIVAREEKDRRDR